MVVVSGLILSSFSPAFFLSNSIHVSEEKNDTLHLQMGKNKTKQKNQDEIQEQKEI